MKTTISAVFAALLLTACQPQASSNPASNPAPANAPNNQVASETVASETTASSVVASEVVASAVSASAASTEVLSSPVEKSQASVQTLTSRDNAVSLTVNAQFEDQSANAERLPEGFTADEITLLQYDSATDITVYIAALGKPQASAKEYYANLKAALEATNGVKNLKVGIATENRMDYSMEWEDGLKESCVAVYHADNLYNICATSPSAASEKLSAMLKDVKLLKNSM